MEAVNNPVVNQANQPVSPQVNPQVSPQVAPETAVPAGEAIGQETIPSGASIVGSQVNPQVSSGKGKFKKLIWIIFFIILLQAGWIGWRVYSINLRKKESLRLSEEKKTERREEAEEGLKNVPEPEIEEE